MRATVHRFAGRVDGIAIRCGVVDDYGETVAPGSVTLNRDALGRGEIPLGFCHGGVVDFDRDGSLTRIRDMRLENGAGVSFAFTGEPLGVVRRLDCDGEAYRMQAELFDSPQGRTALEWLEWMSDHRQPVAISVLRVISREPVRDEVVEISLALEPSCPGCYVTMAGRYAQPREVTCG